MKRIRADHPCFEFRGARVRVARTSRDCDVGEHEKNDWRGAIQPGDTYAWMSHGLSVCHLHFSPEDIENA